MKALAKSVSTVWETYFSEEVFKKVYMQWQQVLEIIFRDEESNKMVDDNHGQLLVSVVLPGLENLTE